MKRSEAVNTFDQGLLMDLNPLVTPNNVITNCLNGTFLTYNGNENMLQNDMGNGRVETAYLPEGYIPLGTAELGGIIYIVSYNPQTGKSQIGSFPSPEKNVMSDELGSPEVTLDISNLIGGVPDIYKDYFSENSSIPKFVVFPKYKLILTKTILNPGDKFQIFSENIKSNKDFISGSDYKGYVDITSNINHNPKWLKLHIIGQDSEGKLKFLDDDLTWYGYNEDGKQTDNEKEAIYRFYIKPETIDVSKDLDEYRNLVKSNYSVYCGNKPVVLGILAELECINTFQAEWDANISSSNDNTQNVNISFNVNWTYENPLTEWRKTINPSKVLVLVDNYTTDKESKKDIEIPIKLPNKDRNNDGNDPPISVTSENLLYTREKASTDPRRLKFTVIPGMEFGYLPHLAKTFEIDLNKLGSGITNLYEWRYYVTEKDVSLNYGFEMYPEKNKKVNKVTIDLYELKDEGIVPTGDIDEGFFKEDYKVYDSRKLTPIDKQSNNEDWIKNLLKKESENGIPASNYHIEVNSDSFSGSFQNTLVYNDNFKYDCCYIAKISITYSGSETVEMRDYYRILYTVPIFNSVYVNTTRIDFSDIVLGEKLSVIPNIVKHKSTYTNTSSNTDENNQLFQATQVMLEEKKGFKVTQDLQVVLNDYKEFTLTTVNGGNLFKYALEKFEDTLSYDSTKSDNKDLQSIKNRVIINYNPKTSWTNRESNLDDVKTPDMYGGKVTITKNQLDSNYVYNLENFTCHQLIPFIFDYTSDESIILKYDLVPLQIKYKGYQHGDSTKNHTKTDGSYILPQLDSGDDGVDYNSILNITPPFSDADISTYVYEHTTSNNLNNDTYMKCSLYDGHSFSSNGFNTLKLDFAAIRGMQTVVIPINLSTNIHAMTLRHILQTFAKTRYKYTSIDKQVIAWFPSNIVFKDNEQLSVSYNWLNTYEFKNGNNNNSYYINSVSFSNVTNLPKNLCIETININYKFHSQPTLITNQDLVNMAQTRGNYYLGLNKKTVLRGIPLITSVYGKKVQLNPQQTTIKFTDSAKPEEIVRRSVELGYYPIVVNPTKSTYDVIVEENDIKFKERNSSSEPITVGTFIDELEEINTLQLLVQTLELMLRNSLLYVNRCLDKNDLGLHRGNARGVLGIGSEDIDDVETATDYYELYLKGHQQILIGDLTT